VSARVSDPEAVGSFYPLLRELGRFLPFRGAMAVFTLDPPSGVVSVDQDPAACPTSVASRMEGSVMKRTRTRTAAVGAVLGVVFVIGSWLQPAAAHIGTPGHLWSQHLRPRADLRYLRNSAVFVSPVFSLSALADISVSRLCPSGMQAIGGGVDFETANANVQVISDAPIVSGANLFAAAEGKNPASGGWRVTMHNNGALAVNGVVGVICSR